MWRFGSHAIARNIGPKCGLSKPRPTSPDCSDDDVSPCATREEALECPICWESFNIVENVPYVLWCGHTLCKNCVLGLQWAAMKFPTLPIQLPLFISCPWCHLLSFRLIYKGELKFPCKNYFLLWMVENMNGDRAKRQEDWPSNSSVQGSCSLHRDNYTVVPQHLHNNHSLFDTSHAEHFSMERIYSSLQKSLVLFVHLTSKFPLVVIFLLIILYAIPASATILALYMLVTILFAAPAFLILYFAYPSLDWLVREIIT
ncbi:uncharacterized protein LOC109713043 [Ananas comosus]|uniref:Uncharacterized protein LOC109713043 n=1 Tax=Ananas comosus TaxID=4615 RepID=A0A6P5FAE2_ANACO|nr:uncharacterized protein LOC109713043 [Ananas comosus]XP_020092568.1 uncharacterized protein LOC109713043 [Ananas comosus]